MRRLVPAVAVLVAVGAMPATAWAAGPPEHDSFIGKDIALTIPALAQCAADGAVTIDLVFNEQFHAVFTDDTYHGSSTWAGTFTTRNAAGDALATGRFVNRSSRQFPRDPVIAITEIIKATGKTNDGERVNIRISFHVTVNAQGETVSEVERVSCG